MERTCEVGIHWKMIIGSSSKIYWLTNNAQISRSMNDLQMKVTMLKNLKNMGGVGKKRGTLCENILTYRSHTSTIERVTFFLYRPYQDHIFFDHIFFHLSRFEQCHHKAPGHSYGNIIYPPQLVNWQASWKWWTVGPFSWSDFSFYGRKTKLFELCSLLRVMNPTHYIVIRCPSCPNNKLGCHLIKVDKIQFSPISFITGQNRGYFTQNLFIYFP